METSPSPIETGGHRLFLTIALVLWILPTAHAQTFEWAELAGGSAPGTSIVRETDRIIGLASDGSNFVYVSGSFKGQAQFGTMTITGAGDRDAFVARYRTDGKLDWVRGIGGSGPDDGFDVKTDGNGTVCTTGDFVETADFGGVSLTSYGGRDVFVACFSSSGALKWARHGGSTTPLSNANWTDYGTDVAIGSDGAVYVTGEFRGTAKFDDISVTSAGRSDGFLAKYDADGSVLWVKRIGGSSDDDGNGLAIDPNGDLILTGFFSGTVDFGSDRLHSAGSWDIYVSKWSPDGDVIWAKGAGGKANDRAGGGIAFDRHGDIYVTGYFKSTATFGTQSLACSGERCGFVWKFAPDGTPAWAVGIYGSGRAIASGIVYSSTDHLYLAGYVEGVAKFGTLIGGTSASLDAFAARLDLSGKFDWARTGGSGADDYGYSIALNGPRAIIAGQVGGDPTFGSITLPYRGATDAFLASIDLRPQPPTLISPAQDAASISTSPSLVWSSVDLATRYDVQVASDAAFANIVYAENTPETHVTFVSPVAEHDYYWRVHGVGLMGPGEWSEVRQFTVGESGPLAPQLTDPADNTVGLSPSQALEWLVAPEADWHRVQVSSSQAFVSPEISVDNLTGPTYQASGLAYETRYFWRVAGVSESGESTWSAPWSFVTMPATVAAPSLVSPAEDASDLTTSPDLVWSPVEHATRYNVQVASDDAFAHLVLTENTPGMQVNFVAPVASHDYFWRVQGVGPVGDGPWSEIRHFSVGNTGPLAPQLASPSDNASGIDISPMLTWLAAPEADWHHLQVADNNSFVSPILDVDRVDRALLVGLKLDYETRYFWRVAGVSESGKSTWSAPWSFVTKPATLAAPSLVSPAEDASDLTTSPDLVWSPVEHATRYNVQVASDDAFAHLVLSENTPGTQVTFVAPVASHDYLWRVQGVGPVGDGPWSEIRHFSVGNTGPLAPQLASPTDSASGIDISPMLTWLAALEADWHHLQVANNNSFVSPVLDVDRVDRALLVGLKLDHETRYFWRVAGVSESGKSTWSAPWSFVTAISPPGEVILLTPESGAEGVQPYASFDWQGIEGVDKYHLQVAHDEAFSTLEVDDSTLTVSQYSVTTPLEYATTYHWRVRAHNVSGFGPWCPEGPFVVAVGTAVEGSDEIPSEYYLAEPYPNPFNPSTRIEFGLPEATDVTVGVFDATGRLTDVLTDGHRPAGRHLVTWHASRVGSGVYFVRMRAGNESRTRTLIVTK